MESFLHGRSTSRTAHTPVTQMIPGENEVLENLWKLQKKMEKGWKTVHSHKRKSGLNYPETTLVPNYQV